MIQTFTCIIQENKNNRDNDKDNLGKNEKQRQQINDEASATYQDN